MSHETERTRRADVTVILAIALPVLLALALVLIRPDGWRGESEGATRTPLRVATVVCPAGIAGKSQSGVSTVVPGASGQAKASGDKPVRLASRKVTELPGNGAASLRVRGEAAPGLIAGRASIQPLTATDCAPTAPERWFTGLGSGPKHSSVVELVNPNKGSAVVDLEVLGEDGPVDAAKLRGVAVPGNSSRTFDLNRVIPGGSYLAVHASVVRGQVAVSVRDGSNQAAGAKLAYDWMAGQAEPSDSVDLMGLPEKGDLRRLAVANPGEDQVSVTPKLITPNAVLEPAGAPEIKVPPSSVRTIDVAGLLGKKSAKDAIGLRLEGSGPITASLRTVAGADPALTPAAPTIEERAALNLPVHASLKDTTLALAGVDGDGSVDVVSRDADGRELATKTVKLAAERGAEVELPKKAALVEVEPHGVTVSGGVRLQSSKGIAVVPLRPLVTESRLPGVAPGLG